MSTVKVSVAKLLKVKNRLVGRLTAATTEVRGYNSVLKEMEGKVDVQKSYERRQAIQKAVLDVKNAVALVNVRIQDVIV